MAAETISLETSLQRQQNKLSKAISNRRGWLTRRTQDPELLKVYGIIQAHISEIQRLLILRQANPSALLSNMDGLKSYLKEMLSKDINAFDINETWEYADALRRMLLLLGDDSYILARLTNEANHKVIQDASLNWGAFLDEDQLKKLREKYEAGGEALTNTQRGQAVEYLSLLYSSRAHHGRNRRAVTDLKARYLSRLRWTLTCLLILLLLGAFFVVQGNFHLGLKGEGFGREVLSVINFPFKFLNEPHVRNFLIAAFAGGVGSVLSGFFKLRDTISRLTDLRAFRAAMSAQPFVGATIGVLFYLIILGGIFRLGLPDKINWSDATTIPWPLIAIYCFIAGFSEPFFLGVVNSVAGAADKKITDDHKGAAAQKDSATDKKKTEGAAG